MVARRAPEHLRVARRAPCEAPLGKRIRGEALLSILRRGDRSEEVRGRAVISLGPILEHADTQGFEDADDLPITERAFHTLQESLRKLYRDANVPKEVRRRILEASVRAPQDWHEDAIRVAYSSGDEVWRLTAVFCMRFVRGFEEQILEALDTEKPDIHYEAVVAAVPSPRSSCPSIRTRSTACCIWRSLSARCSGTRWASARRRRRWRPVRSSASCAASPACSSCARCRSRPNGKSRSPSSPSCRSASCRARNRLGSPATRTLHSAPHHTSSMGTPRPLRRLSRALSTRRTNRGSFSSW